MMDTDMSFDGKIKWTENVCSNTGHVHCLVSKTILIKKKAEKILKHFFILVS